MFIPYEVDAPLDRRPVVNWLVLGVIVLVFIIQVVVSEKFAAEEPEKEIEKPIEEVVKPTAEEEVPEEQTVKRQAITGPMTRFLLDGWGLGLFTYIWLHGGVTRGVIRVAVNLIFLWPFGNAICSKLGNKLYLPVYIGFGLLAGAIHLLLSGVPAAGAAGAISGIVGMYIVLFPENSMSCFFLLPHPMAASISGIWVVLLWFIFDLLEVGLGSQSVTYCAHILCVGAGAGLAVLMLKKNWLVLEKDERSLLQLLSRKEEKEEEKKDSERTEKPQETISKEKAQAPPTISADSRLGQAVPKHTAEPKKPEDDFIRFKCECGHRIKVRKKDAGKTGKCPKCSRWVEAPRE